MISISILFTKFCQVLEDDSNDVSIKDLILGPPFEGKHASSCPLLFHPGSPSVVTSESTRFLQRILSCILDAVIWHPLNSRAGLYIVRS